ncbi:unnamed protein product [Caenorhabditis auriculariae]|uniref:E3 ubiquitin-protein ligase E3D n=1 Tax=Caenorhabditis auriculariae TaxID=2777116 RepID=A0A8S1HS65_9PELO|nr:unnamed protein product [Caenorhabditis auriculariae]
MISYTNVVVFKESILENSVEIEGKNVICTSCRAELGRVQKYHSEMFSFNHLTATLTVGGNRQPYIEKTPQNISVFMAQLVLSTCEAQGSLKLIVRSLDRTPHLLIWLLDSYVILATGQLEKLEEDSGDESGVVLEPFSRPSNFSTRSSMRFPRLVTQERTARIPRLDYWKFRSTAACN